jgi:hypothetical protein
VRQLLHAGGAASTSPRLQRDRLQEAEGCSVTHKCAADGCRKEISMALLMCIRHWRLVPLRTQRAIYRTQYDSDRTRYLSHVGDAKRAVAKAQGTQLEMAAL